MWSPLRMRVKQACLRHCGKQRKIAYRESCNFYHSRTSRRSERVSSEKRYYRYYQLPKRDALQRVEREPYLLGKVDSDDFKVWVEKIFLNNSGDSQSREVLTNTWSLMHGHSKSVIS